jgi:hypothetical protein
VTTSTSSSYRCFTYDARSIPSDSRTIYSTQTRTSPTTTSTITTQDTIYVVGPPTTFTREVVVPRLIFQHLLIRERSATLFTSMITKNLPLSTQTSTSTITVKSLTISTSTVSFFKTQAVIVSATCASFRPDPPPENPIGIQRTYGLSCFDPNLLPLEGQVGEMKDNLLGEAADVLVICKSVLIVQVLTMAQCVWQV